MPKGQKHTDEELRLACLNEERWAQQALYERYFGKLLGIPMRYTGHPDEAKALLNQAFFQIFQSLPDYREQGNFTGWLSTITFRVTMDYLRMQQRHREQYELETSPEPSVSNMAEANLQAEEIFRQIQLLPDYLRAVFSLYVIDGYKHEEIAVTLGISLSTSKWRLSKARQLLQTALKTDYLTQDQTA